MAKVHLLLLFVFLSVWMVTSSYRYLGCYEDQEPLIIRNAYRFYTDDMTIEKCSQTCSIKGFYLAATEYSTQCYCENRLEYYTKSDDNECSSYCGGNSTQKCGGAYRISLYSTNTYLGCYADDDLRLLEGPFIESEEMSTDYCLAYCKAIGKRLALTEYSTYCFCGNVRTRNVLYKKIEDSECDYDCGLPNGEKCGGYWKGSLYLVP